jgi:phosphatidylserine/phosphatidylglycerophosphate/cardiolipin synthase-like enzyme
MANAIVRGVEVHLLLEVARESGGRLAFDAVTALKQSLPRAKVYYWPLERRRVDQHGRHGILHPKCVVVDRKSALVSSANLTDYGLELNMELGLVVQGGPIPIQLAEHFSQLHVKGEIEELG